MIDVNGLIGFYLYLFSLPKNKKESTLLLSAELETVFLAPSTRARLI